MAENINVGVRASETWHEQWASPTETGMDRGEWLSDCEDFGLDGEQIEANGFDIECSLQTKLNSVDESGRAELGWRVDVDCAGDCVAFGVVDFDIDQLVDEEGDGMALIETLYDAIMHIVNENGFLLHPDPNIVEACLTELSQLARA